VWVKGLKETKPSNCKHLEGLSADIPTIYITSFSDYMMIENLIHIWDTLYVNCGTEASYPASVHVHQFIHEYAEISLQYFIVSSSLFLIYHSVIYYRIWLQLKSYCKKIWWLIKSTEFRYTSTYIKVKWAGRIVHVEEEWPMTTGPYTATGHKYQNKGWILMGR
jgi:hypothetical protein